LREGLRHWRVARGPTALKGCAWAYGTGDCSPPTTHKI
jgi:hypothetical protein